MERRGLGGHQSCMFDQLSAGGAGTGRPIEWDSWEEGDLFGVASVLDRAYVLSKTNSALGFTFGGDSSDKTWVEKRMTRRSI